MLQPERVGDNYVVAAVTVINKAGTFTAASGRNYIEPILKNKKKADGNKEEDRENNNT